MALSQDKTPRMKKNLALITALIWSAIVLAQPANDDCSGAQAIGSLPTPAACPSGTGSNKTVTGTLVGATAANPYTYQGTGCTGTNTSMASPAVDVWYSFVATGYQLNLTINSSFANPNVAMYSGTCGALGGGVGGCAVGTAGGAATLTVQQMVIGQTYMIQVSSNSATSTGTFTMNLNNSIDCNNCLGGSNLTVTPPPTNGMYQPGTTVNFCFKINSYTQVNTNWLHGVQIAFGSGWNLASLTTTPPASCAGGGTWAYYPGGCTSSATGNPWPAGFYYETSSGASCLCTNTDPGDNFGDNCSGNISAANWNFCFSITTAAACNPGADLSVVINTSGDGESGVWSSNGCTGDPSTVFHAIGSCCPPTMAATPVTCNAGTDGTATASPVGTQSPFTYSWSPGGGTAQTASGLPAGTYTVEVTDKNNCLATNTVTVTQPTAVTLTLTPTNGSCGNSNGSISASAGGGTPAYTYQLNGGGYAAASTFSSLGAGTYTVDVKDSKGCVKTATVNITVTPVPTVSVNSGTACNGGSVPLTASGATTYSWSPGTGLSGTSGASVTANPASTTVYTVTGTSGGCSSSATATVTVVANPTVTANSATICAGQQTATLTANGATTYAWSPATGLSGTSGTTVTATPASTTVYTITGTAGTCTAVGTATVTVNPIPVVTVNSATICVGQQTATLTANGATSYTWTPSTGLSSPNGSPVTANPASTSTYTVTGSNANGCVNTATSTIVVNPLPTINVNNGFVCNGNSITLTATGASTYNWSPSAGLSATTGSSVSANPATTTQYTVVGTDANGCINQDTTTVTVANNPVVSVTSGTICVGQQTATLTASGAATYNWSPSTGLSATTGSVVTANPGASQTYTVVGTVGTCTAVGTGSVTVNPLPPVSATSATICVGQQTATLTASGATSFSWSPSAGLNSTSGSSITGNPVSTTNYTVVGTDANGCFSSAGATIVVNALPNVSTTGGFICAGGSMTLNASGAVTYSWMPGTGLSSTTAPSVTANPATTTQYTLAGMDANGCINGDTATVTVVNNPTVTATTGTICVGQGTATLTGNGATTYTWSPATGLSSTTGTSVQATPSSTQVYTVTGTVGTCTASGTTTVTVNPLPNITATSNSPVCVNGVLTFTAGGGVSYVWTGPNSFNPSGANPSVNGVTLAAAGVYIVVGVDALGCVNTQTTNVVINPLPVVSATGATVCIGQTINLSSQPSGAAAYSWSDLGTGYTSNNQNPSIPNAALTDAGSYIVTITDGNGCVSAAVANVVVNSLPVISANNGTICGGQTSATLTANGASTYVWAPSAGLSSTSGTSVVAAPASTTTYSVTGTDLNGCQNTSTLVVTVNPAPNVVVTPTNASGCVPLCVTFSNTGGSTGTCTWNYGQGSPDPNCAGYHCYTTAGTYSVSLQIVDVNGCVGTSTTNVVAYPLPHADFNASPQPTTILEPSIQFYDASVGAVISSWHWNFGDNSTSNTSVLQNPGHVYGDTGSYVVELLVISDHGCRDSTFKVIHIDDDYAIYVPNAFSPNADGTNDIFKAVGSGVKDFKMYIFDRWGNQVFFSDNIDKGWDGTFQSRGTEIVQEDVYVWKIEARTIHSDKRLLSGTVSLLK